MKILSCIQTMDPANGGPPIVLNNQIKIINKYKKTVQVFVFQRISIFFLLSCIFLPNRKNKFYKFLLKYDIIHFHELWTIKAILVAYFARRLNIRYLYVGHGYLDPWSIKQRFIKKKLFIKLFLQGAYDYSSASFFSTFSEYIDANKNIRIRNAFIIPNGTDLSLFNQKKYNQNLIKKIVFFGRIHEKKGIEILLEAISNLPKNYFKKFCFEITGPGQTEYVDYIKKRIIEYNISEYVKLVKPIFDKEKITYLKNADVFILPSFEEGDSIALKEAISIGIPVIISKQCRMDIVKEHNAGFVTDTKSSEVLASLLKLEKSDLQEMGNNARILAETYYNNDDCTNRLIHIYEDLFTGNRTSPDWINVENTSSKKVFSS